MKTPSTPSPSLARIARLAFAATLAVFAVGSAHAAAEADLLVAYDQTYTASAGGHDNVQVLAANAIAGSNAINDRCGTGARVRIVGYHEAAQANYQRTSKGGFVGWMANYDSRLSDVVDAGNARGADLITFLCVSTDDGAAAVAQQPGRYSCFDPGQFWSNVVAHELGGHNYGCDHRGGRENPKTVMMHNYCGGGSQGYFSNGNIWLNGVRLLGEGSCLGDAVNGGDNSLLISNTAQGVADRYARVVAAPDLAHVVRHWSFAQPAAAAPAGTTLTDSVTGSALATVQGAGATFTGTGLRLPGGSSGSGAAYLALPAGLVSGYTDVTIEIWATPLSFQAWSRLLDFNNGTSAYFTLSTATGSSLATQRFESRVGGATVTLDSGLATTAGIPRHYAITYASNGAGGGRWTWYRDGDEVAFLDVAYPLSSLPDVNNWLGRSAYAADAFAHCEYSELRVSDVALTRDQVLAHYSLGPNRQAAQNFLTADDPFGQTSFASAGRWSDGLAPSAGKTYETANFRLRTPADTLSRTFAGDSLKLSGGALIWKGTTSSTTTIHQLTLAGSPELLQAGAGTWTLAGQIAVNTTDAMVRGANGPTTISANLGGDGSLLFVGSPATLAGDNSAFTGRIAVGDGRASTLVIDSEARLGPAPAALVANQLVLNRGTLQATGTFALDDPTRGILLDVNGGTFQVPAGATLTLASPLSTPDLGSSVVAGLLRKSGPGTLVLNSPGATFRGNLHVDSGSSSADDGIVRVTNNQVLAAANSPIYINNNSGGSSRLQLDGTGGNLTLPRLSLAGRNGSVPAVQNLAGNNTLGGLTLMAGGANYLIQSDSGRLAFSSGIYGGVTGSRTLTFQGAGDIAVLDTLSELSADTLSIVKLGSGTLTLAGASTHDGSTTLSGGTLRLDGTLTTTGTLGTTAGTTLSGTGSGNATTTIAGTHSPGSVNFTGTQTFTGPLTYAGSARLNWHLASHATTATASNRVAAQGVSVTAGASVHLVLNGPGSTVNFGDAFWTQTRVWPLLTATAQSGHFALGSVSPDSAGNTIDAYGGFQLQQSTTGVSVVFYPLSAAPPAAPTGLSASGSPGAVTLAWSPSAGAVSYRIGRSTTPGGPYETIADEVALTTYTDASVANGTTYHYAIVAVNGLGESEASAELTVTPRAPSILDKADNTLALNLPASWSANVVPTPWDSARWQGLPGANSVNLGAPLALRGLVVGSTGGPVALGAGHTLTLGADGIDLGAATQNLSIAAPLALTAGRQTWTVAAGRTLSLTGALTRSAGSVLLLDKSAGSGSTTSTSIVNAGSTGIVGPWALVKSAGNAANNSAAGHTYATKDLSNNLVPYTGATSQPGTGAWGGIPSGGTGTVNHDLSGAGVFGATGLARSVNTLRYTGTGARQPGNNAGDLLIVGGIMNAGTGAFTIGRDGANITNDFSFGILVGSNNELVLAPMSADLVLHSFIKDGAGGPGVVTIVGNHTVVLAGPNTFTGGLHLDSGALQLAIDNAIGTGPLRIHGGELRSSGAPRTLANAVVLDGSFTLGRNTHFSGAITLADDVTITSANPDSQAAATSLFNGAIGGTRGLAFTTGANPTGTIQLNGANTYAGGTTLESGTLQLGHATALGAATGNLAVNGGTLDLAGFSPTVGRLSGAGGVIANLAGGTATLTARGAADSTFAGSLQNGAPGQILALTKDGSGTLTLSGANTYTGVTTVLGGGLHLTGSLASGSVSVADGASLSGDGSLLGSVAFASGAVHAPGAPAGAQSIGGTITYADGARLRWTLPLNSAASDSAARVSAAGSVVVTAGAAIDLVFNSPGSTVNFTDAFWTQPRSWTVLACATMTGDFDLGSVSPDSAGRPLSDHGTLALQQTATGVTLLFTPTSPAAAWRTAYFGADWASLPEAADEADPDADGLNNLLERAFAGDPLVAEEGVAPQLDDHSPTLSLVYRRSKAATDLVVMVEESTTLGAWTPSTGDDEILADTSDYLLIRHTRPLDQDLRLFLRVQVATP